MFRREHRGETLADPTCINAARVVGMRASNVYFGGLAGGHKSTHHIHNVDQMQLGALKVLTRKKSSIAAMRNTKVTQGLGCITRMKCAIEINKTSAR